MPKPLKLRDTANPIGLKFHEVMRDKNIVADYAAVARAFEVATPSVYDWIDHGRISKDRYPQLVQWSGRPLDWWFNIQPAAHQASDPVVIHQVTPIYDIKNGSKWPFSRSFEAFKRLSQADQARADGYIAAMIDAAQETAGQQDPPHTANHGP